MTHYEASQLLHVSRIEFDALLKSRKVDDHAYDVEDLEQDLETLNDAARTKPFFTASL